MPTKIEWATETYNPITGCTKISAGCQNCYAERMSKRLAGRFGYPADDPFKVTLHPDRLEQPLHWRKARRVFVCSMGDLFHEDVPWGWIESVLSTCAEASRRHTFLFLTKRPERMRDHMAEWAEAQGYLPGNWWLGVTVENQARADERIPVLLQIPAAVRFVSVEPMLGAVDLKPWLPCRTCGNYGIIGYSSDSARDCPDCNCSSYEQEMEGGFLDWIIAGAETGPGARPMSLDWARSLRDQCQAAGVDFFFKKDSDGNRTLDGRLWEQYPEMVDSKEMQRVLV